jgi:hypothetical protein
VSRRTLAERLRAFAASQHVPPSSLFDKAADALEAAERERGDLADIKDCYEAERDALAAQVEQLRSELERVLDTLDALGLTQMPEAAAFGVAFALNIVRSALAASPGLGAPSEPLRCGGG